MLQSLHRLSRYLRGLLKTMAGEDYDPYQNGEADYDGMGIDPSDLEELASLLEALDEKGAGGYVGLDGRQDWALERECEISRLEKENLELRRLLEIDEVTMTERGVKVDLEMLGRGRNATLLANSRRNSPPNESYGPRPSSYWENNGPPPNGPLQRAMELQPGMRAGPQARRTGIFGAGQNRGGFVGGVGRGLNGGPVWSNQPTTPIPGPPPNERVWPPLHSGSSGFDLNR